MNPELLKGKWHQLKGEVKSQWGKLTDDDLDRAEGDAEKLIGRIQERYGYARDDAGAKSMRLSTGTSDKANFGSFSGLVFARPFFILCPVEQRTAVIACPAKALVIGPIDGRPPKPRSVDGPSR